jgi:hypothetical protein
MGDGRWELGVGSWELGVGSWEIIFNSFPLSPKTQSLKPPLSLPVRPILRLEKDIVEFGFR